MIDIISLNFGFLYVYLNDIIVINTQYLLLIVWELSVNFHKLHYSAG